MRVLNRQRSRSGVSKALRGFAEQALRVIAAEHPESFDHFAEVLVVLVSNHQIAVLHRDFLGSFETTDVITFYHGEIVVSVETAEAQARRFNFNLQKELELYVVHGLLHLAGYNDRDRRERAEMTRAQDRLLKKIRRVRII
jgi:probable rRNA maturation factor